MPLDEEIVRARSRFLEQQQSIGSGRTGVGVGAAETAATTPDVVARLLWVSGKPLKRCIEDLN
jgi:hypothetical protein